MAGLGFRYWLKNKLKNFIPLKNKLDEYLGWIFFFINSLFVLSLFGLFFHEIYLIDYEILGGPFLSLIIFYVVFFTVVYAAFRLFLVRLYTRRKRTFLGAYRIILHPSVNLSLLSLLFYLKFKSGLGFDSNLGLLIGIWMTSSAFFALSVAFVWLKYFKKEGNLFQTVWTYRLTASEFKLYIFTIILLALGIFMSISLTQYFLNISQATTVETLGIYLALISYHFFILIIAASTMVITVNVNDVKTKEYCKKCLELIKKRLSKKVGQQVFTSNVEYTRILPDVIDRVNGLLKQYHGYPPQPIFYAGYPPHILNKDQYPKKFLMAEITRDRQRLRDVKEGLDKMSESLEIRGDRFFYPFVQGLTQIANSGEPKPRCNIEETFELTPPSLTRRLKEHQWLIQSFIAFALLSLAILGFII
ncbi:MAG: hypothetical protein CEE41_02365 [Hadesarchaea archaeon B3_Hades]|nr:MAG: hypothetical protein CEE41_02365 [Hadesarchaea archaeon B3_Hades]